MEIKELRKKKKMTQKEFAEFFNIPIRTIQKWEQHDSDPLPYLISLIQDEIDGDEFCDVSKYFRKPQTRFHIRNKNRFKNNDRIHPIMQESVEKIIEELKKYNEVKKIIIFGSSVEERCNFESDLDIYIELSKEINVKTFNIDKPIDFWTNYTVSDAFLKEINKKGVIVYDC